MASRLRLLAHNSLHHVYRMSLIQLKQIPELCPTFNVPISYIAMVKDGVPKMWHLQRNCNAHTSVSFLYKILGEKKMCCPYIMSSRLQLHLSSLYFMGFNIANKSFAVPSILSCTSRVQCHTQILGKQVQKHGTLMPPTVKLHHLHSIQNSDFLGIYVFNAV